MSRLVQYLLAVLIGILHGAFILPAAWRFGQWLAASGFVLMLCVGCEQSAKPPTTYHRNQVVNVRVPLLRIEPGLRQHNYGPSCSHAGFHNSLAVSGLLRVIQHWRKHYGGGAFVGDVEKIAHRYGLRTFKTTSGDLSLLVACHRAGIPCMVHYFPEHSVTFIRFSRDYRCVILQEVNWPREIRIPVSKFVRRWNAYGRRYRFEGGVALALSPADHPPRPVPPPCRANISLSLTHRR